MSVFEYIGNQDQLISYQETKLLGGKSDELRLAHVSNGAGLQVILIPDRCLDIYQVCFKGVNLNYLSPIGIVAPSYYDSDGDQFLRSFFVGMLTTCGLQNTGAPSEANEKKQGLHGRISNTPAEFYTYERGMDSDTPYLILKAKMREMKLFNENLVLEREIKFVYGEDVIYLTDTIRNEAFTARPVVYGLHLNYGYPFLCEKTELRLNTNVQNIQPLTELAAQHIDSWNNIEPPSSPYEERCYYHELIPDEHGTVSYSLFNSELNMGIEVSYLKKELPYFTQWKMLGKGEYVLGLEPFNYLPTDYKIGDERCSAPILEPGESLTYHLKVRGFGQE